MLLLRERYRPLKQIGQGGFGKTFLAWDEDKPSKPYCVIKQFLPSAKGTRTVSKAAELFRAEAVRLDELGRHDQIPELLAHFECEGELYLVQEYIQGQNLAQELDKKGSFDEVLLRQLLTSLLPVLQFIHRHRVIHRDIKPENIIRRQSDENLVLVDFGAAKFVREGDKSREGTAIGTPGYAAPEQLSGRTYFSSDIYSLGVTSIHLLTAMEPSDLVDNGEDRWKWRDYVTATISEGLAAILDRMINRAMNQRYNSAEAILKELETLAKPEPSVRITRFPVKDEENLTVPVDLSCDSQISTQIEVPESDSSLINNNNSNGFEQGKSQIGQSTKISDSPAPQDRASEVTRNRTNLSSANLSQRNTEQSSSVPLPEPVFICGKWGYANSKGKVISQLFDGADRFSEGLAKVKIDNQWGYIEVNGEIFIRPQFEDADRFSDGMAKVKIDGKWGYIDNTGRLAIIPQFNQEVDNFSHGVARVKISSKYGYIDKTGQLISQMFDYVDFFVEGLARVRNSNKYGYIDFSGKLAISLKFDGAENFSAGFAQVALGEKYGYIDQAGQLVSETFNYVDQFCEGLAQVIINEKYGYIDETGKVVIPPKFDYGWDFSEGLAKVAMGYKYGYINKMGTVVIGPRFDNAKDFSQGLAAVAIENKWGYINTKGEMVIDPNFEYAENFHQGRAEVGLKTKLLGVLNRKRKHYIDKDGYFLV